MKNVGCWLLAVGCWFCASLFAADNGTAAPLNFNKHIAPIIYQNCASCHHAGEVAPFPLMSYDDVKKRAKQIVRVTQKKSMPPWKAEPGFGDFVDERRLSDEQIELIKRWADEGAIEGNTADAPKPPVFTDGWCLGPPDMILKMPEAYKVPAEGRDIYRCFVVPIDITEDKYVRAVEYRPGNRRVVHHAILYLDANGAARKKDEADPGPGFRSFGGPGFLPTGGLGGWAPGAMPHPLPDGLAKVIKKGSDLALQLHFHPTGKEEVEQSEIGIYFAKSAPTRVLAGSALGSRQIDIQPGDKNYKVRSSLTLPIDFELIGITPHAHLICKDIKAEAILPDGKKQPLIWIKDWDFNWQDQYQYKSALKLPQGTKIDVEFTYDNSADNPNNPSNPPIRVHNGEQTTDEMAILFLQGVCKDKLDAAKLMGATLLRGVANAFSGGENSGGAGAGGLGGRGKMLEEIKKRFDKDGDGKLNAEEQAEAMKFVREMLEQRNKQ